MVAKTATNKQRWFKRTFFSSLDTDIILTTFNPRRCLFFKKRIIRIVISQASRRVIDFTWRECPVELHSLGQPVQTFTAMTQNATHIVANHPRSLHIASPHEPLLCGAGSQKDASLIMTT